MDTVAELIRLSVLAETMAAENYTAANKELNLAHKELCIFLLEMVLYINGK